MGQKTTFFAKKDSFYKIISYFCIFFFQYGQHQRKNRRHRASAEKQDGLESQMGATTRGEMAETHHSRGLAEPVPEGQSRPERNALA